MPQTPSLEERLQQQNNSLVKAFSEHVQAEGADRGTVEGHEFNLDFYLNHYLMHRGMRGPEAGVATELVRDFLSNYFVRKAMWTDVEEQKSTIQTLVFFYDWLQAKGKVAQTAVQNLKEMIECEQEEWFEALERNSEESLETWQAVNDSDLIEDELYFDFDDDAAAEIDDFSLLIQEIGAPKTDDSGLEPLDEVPELDAHVGEDEDSDEDN